MDLKWKNQTYLKTHIQNNQNNQNQKIYKQINRLIYEFTNGQNDAKQIERERDKSREHLRMKTQDKQTDKYERIQNIRGRKHINKHKDKQTKIGNIKTKRQIDKQTCNNREYLCIR